MIAQFAGPCADCPTFIKPGDRITRGIDGDWSHTQCPIDKVAQVCRTCFMTKPCGCDDE